MATTVMYDLPDNETEIKKCFDRVNLYAGKHCISIDFKNNGEITLWVYRDVNIEEKKDEDLYYKKSPDGDSQK